MQATLSLQSFGLSIPDPIAELGLQNDSAEVQKEMVAIVGKNVFDRIVLELFKTLPSSSHELFAKYVSNKDVEGMRDFLKPYIVDPALFLRHQAEREYEATKTRAREIKEGV